MTGTRPLEREALRTLPHAPAPSLLRWKVWIEPVGQPGAVNMARDQALLEEVKRHGDAAYLRLYCWNPPCLSLGANEPARARYDRTSIERLGLAVVRRPTGGRAVWHEDELTYAVAAPVARFGCLADSYRAIHRRLARALEALGAAVELAPPSRPHGLSAGPCFAQPVGGELLVAGRKVVGSAQVQQGGAFLQHGSILLGGSQEILGRVSRTAQAPPRAATLSEALGRRVSFADVARAIVATWAEAGEMLISDAGPLVEPKMISRFADPNWTWRR